MVRHEAAPGLDGAQEEEDGEREAERERRLHLAGARRVQEHELEGRELDDPGEEGGALVGQVEHQPVGREQREDPQTRGDDAHGHVAVAEHQDGERLAPEEEGRMREGVVDAPLPGELQAEPVAGLHHATRHAVVDAFVAVHEAVAAESVEDHRHGEHDERTGQHDARAHLVPSRRRRAARKPALASTPAREKAAPRPGPG